jgi:hypothetical protein
MTTKNGGRDLIRYYEILASGAIPYFPNINNCLKNIITLLQKN